MAKNIEVKCNFTNIFAQLHSVEDIKAVANNICTQVKEAVEVRFAELKSEKSLSVEVEIETPKSEKKTAKSASAKAKEVAEKLKKVEEKKPAYEKNPPKKDSDNVEISITDAKAIKKLDLKFEKYSEKCWVLYGDTKPLSKELVKFHGVYNSSLRVGKGWLFRPEKAQEVAKALGMKIKIG